MLQVVTVSDHILLYALRKIIIDIIEGCRILLDLFYHQPIYIGDGCVEYEYMELKCDDNGGEIFFIFSKFCNKGPIELNATFDRSLDEIVALQHYLFILFSTKVSIINVSLVVVYQNVCFMNQFKSCCYY